MYAHPLCTFHERIIAYQVFRVSPAQHIYQSLHDYAVEIPAPCTAPTDIHRRKKKVLGRETRVTSGKSYT